MTLLDILKDTSSACGLQGSIDTVNNLKDIQEDLLRAVQRAYQFIQIASDDWKFMNKIVSIKLTTGVETITNTGVARWLWLKWGAKKLTYVPYETYLEEDWTTAGVPLKWTFDEDGMVIVNALDQLYTITYKYVRIPHELQLDSDIPILPPRFHTIIVYKAAADFGSWLGNPEIEDKNLTQYDWLMLMMRRSEIPQKIFDYTPIA